MTVAWLAFAAEAALTQQIPPLELVARCHQERSEEIVVCARPNDQRIREQFAPAAAPAMPRAEWRLSGNTHVSLDAESAGLAGGATSNRAMVRLKFKF